MKITVAVCLFTEGTVRNLMAAAAAIVFNGRSGTLVVRGTFVPR